MRFARWGLVLIAVAVAVGLLASARWTLRAQDRAARAPGVRAAGGSVSVQDALLRPLDLPFAEDSTLEEVRGYLAKALGAQVVLDRSALDRLELTPEDTVRLDLKGVRLKVGLALLLDQVGLSYRVVGEDNLLILTDPESSDDPSTRVLAEIKSIHRDLHDLQDAVDDLRDLVEEDLGIEPEAKKHPPGLVRLGRSRVRGGGRKPTSPRAFPGVRG